MWENICELFEKIGDWGENNFWLALCVAIIAFMQWRTSEKQRKQDLFDKRFEFYDRLKNLYLSLFQREKAGGPKYIEPDDISPYLPEAKWLFGEDMVSAIQDMDGLELNEEDQIFRNLPYNIEKVFNRYMIVENKYHLWKLIWSVIKNIIWFIIPISVVSIKSKIMRAKWKMAEIKHKLKRKK